MPTSTSRISEKDAGDSAQPATQYLDLSEDEFLTRFKPIPNPLSATAGFDFGEGGCLFEPFGPEIKFVRAQPPEKVWTVLEGDDGMTISEGMHFVNRLGYLVTEQPCPPDTFVSVALDG